MDALRAALSPATLLLDATLSGDGARAARALAAAALAGDASARVLVVQGAPLSRRDWLQLSTPGVPPDAARRRVVCAPLRPATAPLLAPIDPHTLLAALAAARACEPAASWLVVVPDALALVDAAATCDAGARLLRALLELGTNSPRTPAPSGPASAAVWTPPALQWRLPSQLCVLLCVPGAGCDVALQQPSCHAETGGGAGLPRSLQQDLVRRATSVVQLAPLVTGFSRDVHGRMWVSARRSSRTGGSDAAGPSDATAVALSPSPACLGWSSLYSCASPDGGLGAALRLIGPPTAASA